MNIPEEFARREERRNAKIEIELRAKERQAVEQEAYEKKIRSGNNSQKGEEEEPWQVRQAAGIKIKHE
jgi:hypothetical protein